MAFKKSFCWRSNLSNDVIISVYVNIYVAFCDLLQIWKRVWKWHFLVWNGVRFFLRTGRHNPLRIHRSTPRGPQTSFWGRGLAGRPEFGEPIKTQMQTFLYLIIWEQLYLTFYRDSSWWVKNASQGCWPLKQIPQGTLRLHWTNRAV